MVFFMALSKQPYKGTRDFFPPLKRGQDWMCEKMHQTAQSFGYEHYDGPLLEEVNLYRAKSGEELINDQIYSFIDRGGREVAIRPEMTPTLARMISQVHREVSRPIRWYSIPNLMRYERPQKGRLREHWQFNVDIFGGPPDFSEIEILQLAISLLTQYGADHHHFEVLINNRKLVDFLFAQVMKLDEQKSYKLYKLIDKSKKLAPDKFTSELLELGLEEKANELFKSYLKLASFSDVLNFAKQISFPHEVWDIEKFHNSCKSLNISEYLKFDPTIVRGLDYYTGLVFEIFDKNPENRRAISGGGSYEKLLEIFGEEAVPGVGLGMGDVTLHDFLQTHNLFPDFSLPSNDVFVSIQTEDALIPSMKLSQQLRKCGLKVVTSPSPTKFNKLFDHAEKKGSSFVSIMGSDEVKKGTCLIKNLKTKAQQEFSLSDVSAIHNFIQQLDSRPLK